MNHLQRAHVLVTRPAQQAENLCRLVEQHGGIAIRFPTLEIVPVDDDSTARILVTDENRFQWLVFISVNAVNFALKANGGKIGPFKQTRIAAIGQATAQALANAGLPPDLVPDRESSSEALLAMPQMQLHVGQRCLIVRGQGGREELADTLREKGVEVEYLEVYKRVMPDIDPTPVVSLLTADRLAFVIITSGEALQNLLLMLGKECHETLFAIPLVTVSNRIKNIASRMGFKRITVTDPSDAAIINTITTLIHGEQSGRSE